MCFRPEELGSPRTEVLSHPLGGQQFAMSSVFYLCSVPHHVQRLDVPGGSSSHRLRCSFPHAPFFMELVHARELQHWLTRNSNSPAQHFIITGLLKVRPGVASQDAISQYPHRHELAVWKHFWRGAANAFTILVDELHVSSSISRSLCLLALTNVLEAM